MFSGQSIVPGTILKRFALIMAQHMAALVKAQHMAPALRTISRPFGSIHQHACQQAAGAAQEARNADLHKPLDISRGRAAAEVDTNNGSRLALAPQKVQDDDCLADAALSREQAGPV